MLYIVKFKGCKRCGGDLFLERDSDGVDIACLQCGAVYTRLSEGVNPKEVPREELLGAATVPSGTDYSKTE